MGSSGGAVGAGTITAAMLAPTAAPRNLAGYIANVSSTHTDGTEDDLFTTTLAAAQLSANGQKLNFRYVVTAVGHATATRKLKVYFGGTAIFDSTAIALAATASTLAIQGEIVRVSASVIRAMVSVVPSTGLTALAVGALVPAAYTEVTGLTLANTQIIKLTGASAGVGAASADIVAKAGSVDFFPAA